MLDISLVLYMVPLISVTILFVLGWFYVPFVYKLAIPIRSWQLPADQLSSPELFLRRLTMAINATHKRSVGYRLHDNQELLMRLANLSSAGPTANKVFQLSIGLARIVCRTDGKVVLYISPIIYLFFASCWLLSFPMESNYFKYAVPLALPILLLQDFFLYQGLFQTLEENINAFSNKPINDISDSIE